jgi:hypothetical protein
LMHDLSFGENINTTLTLLHDSLLILKVLKLKYRVSIHLYVIFYNSCKFYLFRLVLVQQRVKTASHPNTTSSWFVLLLTFDLVGINSQYIYWWNWFVRVSHIWWVVYIAHMHGQGQSLGSHTKEKT